MRSILAIAASLLLCAIAQAAPVDSSASGVYIGWDRTCRIVLSRYQSAWVQVDIRCLSFDGAQTASLTTVYAPDKCPQDIGYWLNPGETPPEYLSLRSFGLIGSDAALAVVLGGDQTDVTNGIGSAQNWIRVATLQAPDPYSCAGSEAPIYIDPHALARYCRQNPTVPACRG